MNAKTNAAIEALKYVKNGQTVGLGTGSTAAIFIDLLSKKVQNENLKIKCIPTSLSSKALAYQKGLVLIEPEEITTIDVAVDGADCIDSKKNLIKGGGGAHTREKIIDYFAQKFIVFADDSKFSKVLKGPVPLELLPFAYSFVEKAIKKEFGIKTELRRRENGDVWKSDNGNFIADAHFRSIKNPKKLEGQLNAIPGIVENGIFSKNVSTVIIGYEKKVRVLK